MKKLTIVFAASLIAATASANTANLTGLWHAQFDQQPNAIIIDENINGKVNIMGTYIHRGAGRMVWMATGKVKKDKLIFSYKHNQTTSPFLPGQAVMQISKDGNTLTGKIRENTGQFSQQQIWVRDQN